MEEFYKNLRRYGKIEFDSEWCDSSGHYREMRISLGGCCWYVKMHNGNVLKVK